MHAHLDRTGLESIVFSEPSAVTLSSCSGAGSLKPLIYEDATESSTMTEPLDAELLKDLRGLGKPPSADGNDAEYQDFRFSFRIHMSLVSTASQPLMDKCEIERNTISLAAVKALGDAHLKCCIQMYYSLALTTKGNVRRSLVRSVEESNGAEAWRLIQNRYAPDTQNRQYALMQKIMMLAKHWCDHEEGFESGLRARELDVGEWERASGTALADAVKNTVLFMAPIFLSSSLQLGAHSNSAALRTALLQWCYSSRKFGANPTVSAGNGTSADDDRMQADSQERQGEGQRQTHQIQKGNRTTKTTNTTNTSSADINTCKNWAELNIGRKTAGDQVEERTTSHTSNNSNTQKGKNH